MYIICTVAPALVRLKFIKPSGPSADLGPCFYPTATITFRDYRPAIIIIITSCASLILTNATITSVTVMKLLTRCSTHYCSCSLTYILGIYDVPKHNMIDITYYTYCQFLIYIQTPFILVSCIIV